MTEKTTYAYDPDTGAYLGTTAADESPLEPGVFLYPAHTVKDAPPKPATHQIPVWSGSQWTLTDDYRGTVYYDADGTKHTIEKIGVVPPSGSTSTLPLSARLSNAKRIQITQLTEAYQSAIQADIQFTNAAGTTQTYQADAQSRSNLHDMLDGFSVSKQVPSGFYWVAKDNSHVAFTYADMQGLAEALATRGAAAFARLQDLKGKVRAVQSTDTNPIQTVQAITWSAP